MNSRSIAVAIVMLFVFSALASNDKPINVAVPDLPTARDEFGARPGTFHFVPNEDAIAQAKQLQNAVGALNRLDSITGGMRTEDRRGMEEQLAILRTFAADVQRSRTTTAGDSAGRIEQRLNDAKGRYMCGACHGHGMMHGMRDQMR